MHVPLVLVTKYRRCILDGQAQLRQMEGGIDHVHVLVRYPPKVCVSSLVNSVKGVSSYVLRRQLPQMAKCYGKNVRWSSSEFAASCCGAPLDIKRYIEQQAKPL